MDTVSLYSKNTITILLLISIAIGHWKNDYKDFYTIRYDLANTYFWKDDYCSLLFLFNYIFVRIN